MTDVVNIRAETDEDFAAVRRVNELAFGQPAEAALVEALRRAARPHLSLVAEDGGGRVVGHIFFSPVTVEPAGGGATNAAGGDSSNAADAGATGETAGGAEVKAGGGSFACMGLAPMAVLPEWQRRGVGSRLVRAGLDECRRAGFAAVFVLGHADYYPRFGFRAAAPLGFRSEYDVPAEYFMLLELRPGALAPRRPGLVKYHPEFARV